MRISRPCAAASCAQRRTRAPASANALRLNIIARVERIRSRLEADLWQCAIAFLGLEEFQLLVAHRSREEVGWERGDRGIEVAHDGVVVAPSVLDGVFYGSELRLEIAE